MVQFAVQITQRPSLSVDNQVVLEIASTKRWPDDSAWRVSVAWDGIGAYVLSTLYTCC